MTRIIIPIFVIVILIGCASSKDIRSNYADGNNEAKVGRCIVNLKPAWGGVWNPKEGDALFIDGQLVKTEKIDNTLLPHTIKVYDKLLEEGKHTLMIPGNKSLKQVQDFTVYANRMAIIKITEKSIYSSTKKRFKITISHE